MIETVMTAQEHFVKALLVNHPELERARQRDDVIQAERVLKAAYAADVRPFLAEYRQSRNLPADPLMAFRESGYETRAAAARAGTKTRTPDSYA
jgi:L-rhamnose isomerase/sugar isomerase